MQKHALPRPSKKPSAAEEVVSAVVQKVALAAGLHRLSDVVRCLGAAFLAPRPSVQVLSGLLVGPHTAMP
jgi:hypothetical protein